MLVLFIWSRALPGSRDRRAGPEALPAVEGKGAEPRGPSQGGRERMRWQQGDGAEVGSEDAKPSGGEQAPGFILEA